MDSTDGHYVGVFAGDDVTGTFDLTIERGTLTGAATLESGGTERTHVLEVVSGDPSSGHFEIRVGGFTGDATISDGSLEVDLRPADGGGTVARADGVWTEGDAEFYCGTYSGGDDGQWNNVVTAEGNVSGSFWGSLAEGSLKGTTDGSTTSVDWHGEAAGFGGTVSGTATGTREGDSIEGTWSGSGYSGTWTTTQTCPGG
ncbi:MAG: hypothetical protein ACOCXM_11825 [Myxococcota bacterium]